MLAFKIRQVGDGFDFDETQYVNQELKILKAWAGKHNQLLLNPGSGGGSINDVLALLLVKQKSRNFHVMTGQSF